MMRARGPRSRPGRAGLSPISRGLRTGWSLGLLLFPAAGGCAPKPSPIFDQARPDLAWPAPPAPPRVRYLGQLRSTADLQAPPKPFQALADLLVGGREPDHLYGPRAVYCTPDGQRVWIADPGGRRVHCFDLKARNYRKILKMGDHPLLCPVDVCAGPGDSIYVCDSEAAAIHRLAGSGGALLESVRLPEEVQRPVGVRYDAAQGELFVVDSAAHDVKVLGADGSLRRIIGQRGREPGEFNYPSALADDGDMIWVVDTGNSRVQGLSKAGAPLATFGQAGDAPGDLALPKGLARDSDGHLYVVDARFENVQIFDRSGQLLLFFGQEGTGPGEFWLPAGVFIDALDRIWVCDAYNGRVQVFAYVRQARPDGPPAPGPGGASADWPTTAPHQGDVP